MLILDYFNISSQARHTTQAIQDVTVSRIPYNISQIYGIMK